MTYLEMQTEVARYSRLQMDNANHVTFLKFWLNRAQEAVGSEHSWWFLQHEFSIALTADDRSYPFPDSDIDSVTADLEGIDQNSMRTKGRSLGFIWPSQADRLSRTWTDQSVAGTGTPQWFSIVREIIMLDKFPSTGFVTNNPTLYFRGYIRMADLSADEDISVVPKQYHDVLVQGAKWRAYERQGVDDWRAAQALYKDMVRDMITRCRPVRGRGRKVGAPDVFKITGRRSSNVVN